MKQTINKKGNNLEIKLTIPLKRKRFGSYEQTEEEMDAVAGFVEESFDKCGFVYWIDMGYKGKADQWSDYFYIYDGQIEDFEKLCKKLKLSIIYD